jgi:hypothetical protein
MDWITDRVAIGNYLEAQDPELLRRSGFQSVLSLDGTLSSEDACRLGVGAVAAFRLIDGAGNDLRVFRLAVESLGELVHCHAGAVQWSSWPGTWPSRSASTSMRPLPGWRLCAR